MRSAPMITLDILPGKAGEPPTVRASACTDGHNSMAGNAIMGDSDTALVARAMLSSAAYLFAQGQPVAFGPEVPKEALK